MDLKVGLFECVFLYFSLIAYIFFFLSLAGVIYENIKIWYYENIKHLFSDLLLWFTCDLFIIQEFSIY